MKKRILIVSLGTFALFSLLIARYFHIQVVEGEKWTEIALGQHEVVVDMPFRRGTFFSNTSVKRGHVERVQPLVVDVTKFHLYVDPVSIPHEHKGAVAAGVADVLQVEEGRVREELAKRSRSRRVVQWVEKEEKEAVLAWWHAYAREARLPRNALYFVTDYQRSYPFGQMLGPVLHTIRGMKEEKTLVGVPTGGLEASLNAYVKGKLGKRVLLRSPRNPLETDQVLEAPEDGADVYLTLNHCIQAIAEEELEKGVRAAHAKGGWAVMMDPHSGEILALAQYPFFEPSRYAEYFNDVEKIEQTKVHALTDAFELGSIMKPITMAIALHAGELDPHVAVDTTRTQFPGRGGKPLRDTSSHKRLNMPMAIQKSSNVYMAQVIERVIERYGNQWYRDALTEIFGFDQKTGIELPGEATGLVPTPGKLHPNGALEWSVPTPYSLAMGHNIISTSLQMVRAYAVFANGGILVQPTLVRKIVQGGECLVDHTRLERREGFPRVLSHDVVNQVVAAMKYTTKPGGTGWMAEVSGYSEAGKTGTAEKIVGGVYSKERYISSFVGFAPASLDPHVKAQFVLIVTIDEPARIFLEGGGRNYHGGRCAAPVFREITRRTLDYLGVPPDDPFGYPPGDPRYDADKADWVRETRALKTLYEQWNR